MLWSNILKKSLEDVLEEYINQKKNVALQLQYEKKHISNT